MASFCRSCGAPIMWIKTPLGKWMPVDEGLHEYKRDENGKTTLVNDRGEVIRCSIEFEGKADGSARLPHWATCPNADMHRKRSMT